MATQEGHKRMTERTRERVVDFLSKINSEGPEYFFLSYADPETVRSMAASAGVREHLKRSLVDRAHELRLAFDALQDVLDQIREDHGIEEEEIEV